MTSPKPATTAAQRRAASDLRGLSRLAVDATLGITDLVEAMHQTIAASATAGLSGGRRAGRTAGITGFVYRSVRGTTRLVGAGLDAAFSGVSRAPAGMAPNARREALLAALNGVFGDHLADSGNPLAITMALRRDGHALTLERAALESGLPEATDRVLLLVHGLCMNDLQWRHAGHDHGQALAQALGLTPLYLHYNSGRHVSQNGAALSDLLDTLAAQWPVPLREIVVVAHSMGGLVARSAVHQAAHSARPWAALVKKWVFLGTPHHGAPLERGGRLVDTALGFSRYAAPFARLGKARSAGITDLRYGNLQDADWQGRDRHAQHRDDRQPTPLPKGVATFLVAATQSAHSSPPHAALRGDGLVPVASALGEHARAKRALKVPATQQFILPSANHWDLLGSPEVMAQMTRWLG
jgi:alpha-beta hydrolase superfamily lysophospholipase